MSLCKKFQALTILKAKKNFGYQIQYNIFVNEYLLPLIVEWDKESQYCYPLVNCFLALCFYLFISIKVIIYLFISTQYNLYMLKV